MLKKHLDFFHHEDGQLLEKHLKLNVGTQNTFLSWNFWSPPLCAGVLHHWAARQCGLPGKEGLHCKTVLIG